MELGVMFQKWHLYMDLPKHKQTHNTFNSKEMLGFLLGQKKDREIIQ